MYKLENSRCQTRKEGSYSGKEKYIHELPVGSNAQKQVSSLGKQAENRETIEIIKWGVRQKNETL